MISKNIARRIRLYLHRVMWKKRNKHNNTYAVSYFHIENVKVGIQTYGPIEILYDSGNSKVCIGNYCSIAQNTKILVGGGCMNIKELPHFHFRHWCIMGILQRMIL